MDIGQCVGCMAEEIEINEDGYCTDCAALEGAEETKMDDLTEEEV